MFGYVTTYKPELKVKEYYKYRAYYCGLCEVLRRDYGVRGQMTLSYDMTFFVLLLTSLYECDSEYIMKRCKVHPMRKSPMIMNEMTHYAAGMNIVLAYYHFEDDFTDDHSLKGLAGKLAIKGYVKRIEKQYPRQCKAIKAGLKKLSAYEKKDVQDIDLMAGCFGDILAEVAVYKKDQWEEKLRRIGFYLGKFIYIMDAVDDVQDDIKKKRYNPMRQMYEKAEKKAFYEQSRQILLMMISEAADSFELLPCLNDASILRNILYAGVWNSFNKLTKETGKQDEMIELLKEDKV